MTKLPLDNFRSPLPLALFAGTTLAGVGFDLWSKVAAFDKLADGTVYRFIPGLLHFQITINHGAVFGLGQGMRAFFIAVSVIAILVLTTMFAFSGRQRGYQLLLGMLLAGVLGNMYDRLTYGYVRDMIHALPGWHWPGAWTLSLIAYPPEGREVFPWIFNVADSLLVVGVALMFLRGIFLEAASSSRQSAAQDSAPGNNHPAATP